MTNRKLEDSCILGCSALLIACASVVAEPTGAGDSRADEARLARRCETVTVRTAEDLLAARGCGEIDGDLLLRAHDLESVAEDSLPHLRRITGSLISVGSRPLRELVLPALREVGSEPTDLLEIALDLSTLERIELPALEQVTGNFGIVGLGGLHTLDLSSLERVSGVFALINLPNLDDLRVPDGVQAERTTFEYLCAWPVSELPDSAAQLREVGCCTPTATPCGSAVCTCQ